ncbi:hypothetical protein [Desmonostoc muscorum]|uniref:hypothetical protein n=1 Tax=Desmonostoc muscorum TaxID=1179 RepID=UPI001F46D6CE|nr:hypothetical protein [Desmonostoc muscorum]
MIKILDRKDAINRVSYLNRSVLRTDGLEEFPTRVGGFLASFNGGLAQKNHSIKGIFC